MLKAEALHHIRLIRESSRPLEPLPPLLEGEWEALAAAPFPEGIRAVLFDLYGTLFVSGAGDIAAAPETRTADPSAEELAAMGAYFRREVRRLHDEAHQAGQAWPEVRAEAIWAGYTGPVPAEWEGTEKLRAVLARIGGGAKSASLGRELALRYELAVNPVYPMPGALETLEALAQQGVVLGIISNAQFYTPLLFNAFFDRAPEELGFDPALLFYSFAEGEAKPSPRLFAKAREALGLRGIGAEAVLYAGNDMGNDIVPAGDAGFKTALFAGDRRSLRLREDDPRCVNRKPTLVLKDLQSALRGR